MKTAIAWLNYVIDQRGPGVFVSPEDARLALHAIESQRLMVGALRLVTGQRKNIAGVKNAGVTEALDHVEKLLELHDAYTAKHAAPVVAQELAPAKVVSDQDVADLV